MKIDYSAIADRAEALGLPGDYEAAYVAMVAESVTRARAEAVYSRRRLLRALGIRTGLGLLGRIRQSIESDSALDAGARSVLHELVADAEGLDLSDADLRNLLKGWRDDAAVPFTAEDFATLAGLATESVPAWPGLLPGHVQTALDKRARGVA